MTTAYVRLQVREPGERADALVRAVCVAFNRTGTAPRTKGTVWISVPMAVPVARERAKRVLAGNGDPDGEIVRVTGVALLPTTPLQDQSTGDSQVRVILDNADARRLEAALAAPHDEPHIAAFETFEPVTATITVGHVHVEGVVRELNRRDVFRVEDMDGRVILETEVG